MNEKILELSKNKRIIVNVKNESEKYSFSKSMEIPVLLLLFLLVLIIIFFLYIYFGINFYLMLSITPIILIAPCILILKASHTRIYFSHKKLIISNLIKTEAEFDINEYPRIFVETFHYHNYQTSANTTYYYLCLQQKEKRYSMLIGANNIKNIIKLLDNLETVPLEEISEKEKMMAANEKERIMHNYEKENPARIIVGIKDSQKIITFKNDNPIMKVLAWIALFIVLATSFFLLSSIGFKTESFFCILFIQSLIILFVAFGLIYQYIAYIIKISYYNDEIIKVNDVEFNYRKNVVKIQFRKKILTEKIKYEKNGDPLSDYIMEISDDNGKSIKKELDKKNTAKVEELLANLEFSKF